MVEPKLVFYWNFKGNCIHCGSEAITANGTLTTPPIWMQLVDQELGFGERHWKSERFYCQRCMQLFDVVEESYHR